MLAKRIIPCLDVCEGRVVKGVQFLDLQDAGDPVEQARFYDQAGADELVFLDITASWEKRKIMLDVVRAVAASVFIPFSVGGGIQDCETIQALLRAGADKVSLNTAAVENPRLVREAAARFGNQCIVVAIDAKRRPGRLPDWEVYIHGGRTETGFSVRAWAEQVVKWGAGEILLTSMDRDGTQDGYDVALTQFVANEVPVPVIASGGAGALPHFQTVFEEGKADAALLASLLHFRKLTIAEIKMYLHQHQISVRL